MAQTSLNIRMDEILKKQFCALCNDFGMNASAAINIYAKAVVRQRRIPFDITAGENQFGSWAEQAYLPETAAPLESALSPKPKAAKATDGNAASRKIPEKPKNRGRR